MEDPLEDEEANENQEQGYQEKEMKARVHYLRTWRRVTIRGQDGECGDELLPDPEESKAKINREAGKEDKVSIFILFLTCWKSKALNFL